MTAYIVRRLIATLPVMAIVAICVFLLLHLSPGDPAAVIAGDNATPANIEMIRKRLGLDEPLWKQFLLWVGQILRGDLGQSMFWNTPVLDLVGQRYEPTLSLALTTLIVAISVAVTLGVLAAWRVATFVDRAVMGFAVLGFSVPVFVVGYLLIYVFAIQLKWLPVQGYTPIAEGLVPWLRNLILPSIALGLAYVALIARITRATMLDVLAEDYIRTARAKGLRRPVVLLVHALKNAAVPVVTMIGIGFGILLSGVVVTESVFAIPGIGRLTVDAIFRRDFPVIQGVVLVMSAVYVLLNLLVDLSYMLFDPRIRY
jgi:peptide/nickel transport system permease protein